MAVDKLWISFVAEKKQKAMPLNNSEIVIRVYPQRLVDKSVVN